MEKVQNTNFVSGTFEKKEWTLELWNAISHGLGVPLGICFLVLLVIKEAQRGSAVGIIGYSIYGACFIWLFFWSTLYHSIQAPRAKAVLRIFDHTAIYVFIAGTFTPAILLLNRGWVRVLFLVFIWLLALAGTIFKVVTHGNYNKWGKVSVILYICMGWLGLLFLKPIIENRLWGFLIFTLLSGILYTAGTYFYRKESWKWTHLVWHFFVLFAAISQFIGFYFFL